MIKNKMNKHAISIALATLFSASATSHMAFAEGLTEALTSGTTKVDFNLRYETVDQKNALKQASALTLRILLAYETGRYNGFSAKVEMEDSRIVLGQGDYTVGPTGYNLGKYSVIADPQHTELDQGYIQYKSDTFTAKMGRQMITMDGHRFIGHVGWRQDRQTFDALSAKYAPVKDLTLQYAHITQRNRIFDQVADVDSKDHLINASYKTSAGTLTAYGYLLEVDNNNDNALDTYGVRFAGSTKVGDTKILYQAQYASQSSKSQAADFDVDYLNLEAAAVLGDITA